MAQWAASNRWTVNPGSWGWSDCFVPPDPGGLPVNVLAVLTGGFELAGSCGLLLVFHWKYDGE